MHTLKEVKRDDVCVCAIGAQIGFWVLLKNRCVFLCVFVCDDLFTSSYEHTQKKGKRRLEKPLPPHP